MIIYNNWGGHLCYETVNNLITYLHGYFLGKRILHHQIPIFISFLLILFLYPFPLSILPLCISLTSFYLWFLLHSSDLSLLCFSLLSIFCSLLQPEIKADRSRTFSHGSLIFHVVFTHMSEYEILVKNGSCYQAPFWSFIRPNRGRSNLEESWVE